MILSPHEIAYLVTTTWPASEFEVAIAVALAESGGDTDALARSTEGDNLGQRDHGLWQISGRWHGSKLQTMGDWRNPYHNAAMAYAVWAERKSWSPWSVFTSGSYAKYLPDARIALKMPVPPPLPTSTTIPQIAASVAVIRGHFTP
jgi:hypothetical protein